MLSAPSDYSIVHTSCCHTRRGYVRPVDVSGACGARRLGIPPMAFWCM